jgi:hypothetical protein
MKPIDTQIYLFEAFLLQFTNYRDELHILFNSTNAKEK